MSSTVKPPASGEVVLLTGSTGSLGTHLLGALLSNPTVSHIYCLNRNENAEELHEAKAKANSLQLEKNVHRVSFIHAILNKPSLGLDETLYRFLQSTTTLIIHNAWPVNFVIPFNNFIPQLDGMANLFKFASNSTVTARFLFVSSVSSVSRLSESPEFKGIPEKVVRNLKAPLEIGYAKSKLVGELLCDKGAQHLKIPVSFARVGQIAGPVEGKVASIWNTYEWLPSLILTSISFGALPKDLGAELNRIDWVPVDLVAKSLVELGTNRDESVNAPEGANVFNVVNPQAITWKELLPSFVASLEKHANKPIEAIPLQSWLHRLQMASDNFTAGNSDLISTHPAIKLLDFYEMAMLNRERAVDWQTAHATAKSKTLKELSAVCDEWVDKWVEGWVSELNTRRMEDILTKTVSKGAFLR